MSQAAPKSMPLESYRSWLKRRKALNVEMQCASVMCGGELAGGCSIGSNGLVYCPACTKNMPSSLKRVSGLSLLAHLASQG